MLDALRKWLVGLVISPVTVLKWLGELLSGYKTYVSATGLVGLSVYYFSVGKYEEAVAAFLASGLATGLRHALDRVLKRDPKPDNPTPPKPPEPIDWKS